jgi:hypothetical protein
LKPNSGVCSLMKRNANATAASAIPGRGEQDGQGAAVSARNTLARGQQAQSYCGRA